MKLNYNFLLICFLSFIYYLSAQSTSGKIEGWIYDSGNNPINTANITVLSSDSLVVRGASSNVRGYFLVPALPVGVYSVKITHLSFQTVVVNKVKVLLGQTTGLGEVYLREDTIKTEEIIVIAEKQISEYLSTTYGKNLSADHFTNLPIERNYLSISELLPHANLSFKKDGGTNFAGATGLENKYFIDGADVTDPIDGNRHFEMPYNFIREVEIRTGGYQAEYEGSLGGVVNSITNSGSNEIHGTMFGFYTNNNFSQSQRIAFGDPPAGNYSNYDIGFGIGGPVIHDKLWYYAAYDPNIVHEDVPVQGLENQKSHFVQHKFAAKISWNLNQSNFLTLSIFGNPSAGRDILNSRSGLTVASPDYCNYNFNSSQISTTINGAHILNELLMFQSSFSLIERSYKRSAATELGKESFFDDYVTGIASGGYGRSVDKNVQQIGFTFKGTLILTDHIIKAGLEYQQNSESGSSTLQGFERYQTKYCSYDAAEDGNEKIKQYNPSIFIQDSWQISRYLCLNAGIRWSPQWFIASDGSIGQKFLDPLQPRFGIVYQLPGSQLQKISASFGRFYQPLHLSLASLYHYKNAKYLYIEYPNDPRVDTSGGKIWDLTSFVTNVPDIKAQYFDEITLGYEILISSGYKIGIRGIYRRLGQGIEDGVLSKQDSVKYGSLQAYGNPGSGLLSMFPKMKRNYTALEIELEKFSSDRLNFFLSYVFSINTGNYDGLAETNDVTGASLLMPNITNQFGLPERMNNSDGLLPNDRTHVLKLFGSYVFDFGLTTGMMLQWMSGTPLNEFGMASIINASTFLQERGSVGRTPAIWDLSFRLKYDVSEVIQIVDSANLIADILHIASQRVAVDYDQYHYWNYEQTEENAQYMEPVMFQPPMSVRIGMEVIF